MNPGSPRFFFFGIKVLYYSFVYINNDGRGTEEDFFEMHFPNFRLEERARERDPLRK